MLNLHYNTIIVISILIQGYLISRIFIYCGISQFLSESFIEKSKGNISKLLLYSLITASLLSLITPNIICMLSMLPILRSLKDDIHHLDISISHKSKVISLLVFITMFGANLGGLGSITGSPLNILVLWFITAHHLAFAQNVNFFTWLLWGIPIVIVVGFFSYQFIKLFIPKELLNKNFNRISLKEKTALKHHHFNLGVCISIFSILGWLLFSALSQFQKQTQGVIASFSVIYVLILIIFLFFIPLSHPISKKKSPLVPFKGISTDIPTKGILIVILSIFLSYLFQFFKVDIWIAQHFKNLATFTANHYVLLVFIFCAFAIFMSEFLSNTASTILLFNIALPFATGDLAVPLMLAISLSSSIPSMTPMASPVNAFAYGSIENSFSRTLFGIGFMVNMIAITIITLFTCFFMKNIMGYL